MNIFYSLIDSFKAARAISEAKRLNSLTLRIHYVFKIGKKYHVLNRPQILNLQKRGVFNKELDIMKLERLAYYKTSWK